MQDDVHSQLAIAPFEPGTLAATGGADPYTTEFVRLAPGDAWTGPSDGAADGPADGPADGAANGADIQVLVAEGTLDWGPRALGQGSYLRFPWVSGRTVRSGKGCSLLIKSRLEGTESDRTIAVDAVNAPWAAGQGNLRVLPLDSRDQESTALVHWPAGERFLPHRHFGGEEIFVLSGTFRDEHGSYPAGSWIQSPHGSVHHPFVVEETRIWVKTGHLPPPTKP